MSKKIKVGDKVITKRGAETSGSFWWVGLKGVVATVYEVVNPGDRKYDVRFPSGQGAYLYEDEITRVKKKKKSKGTLSPEPVVLRTVPVCEMQQPEVDYEAKYKELVAALEVLTQVARAFKDGD